MTANKLSLTHALRAIAILIGSALAASSASAQGTIWTNQILGNWFVSGNWSNGIPNSTFQNVDASIDNGGIALINAPGAASHDLGVGRALVGGGLTISNGGTLVQNGRASVGTSANQTASVTVSGNGSRWDVAQAISAGSNATVRVESGADITSGHPRFLDFYPGGAPGGSVVVTGAGSTWTMSDTFTVGFTLPASLTVSGGGSVSNFAGIIGWSSGSSATATITGTGSIWNNSESLYVGLDGGVGALRINDRGVVQAASLRVSSASSVEVNNGLSNAAGLNVVGGATPSSQAGGLGSLIVANTSSGRMVVQSGGTVENSLGTVGANVGTVGSVLVDGVNSNWTNTDNVVVGLNGNGTLDVRNGAKLASVRGFAGANQFSTGAITVSDPGSAWTASGSYFIGNSGTGLLQVLNGGVASTTGNCHLGFTASATGDVNVSGADSTLTIAARLNVGGDSAVARGAGSVRIADGGVVNVGDGVYLYSTGKLDLVNEATMTGDIYASGGRIRTFGDTTLGSPIHIDASGLSVETNAADGVATFGGVIDGVGGLTKNTLIGITGHGTLALDGANTYSGPTMVNLGTLLVNGSITSMTTVANGATLGGSGLIAADVINNGEVAPGNSPGTLHVQGNYAQTVGGALELEIGGVASGSYDQLIVGGNANIQGEIVLKLIDGFLPQAGDQFHVLSVDGTYGNTAAVSFTGASAGWQFSQTYDPVAGTLVLTALTDAQPLAGSEADFNGDGQVDGADLARWEEHVGTGDAHDEGDADGDKDVDGDDLLTWQRQLVSPITVAASAAVPEPATLVLLVSGTLAAWIRRTSKRHSHMGQ